MKNTNKLIDLAKPICGWLQENGNPYTQVIISKNGIRVAEDVYGFQDSKIESVKDLADKMIECLDKKLTYQQKNINII